MTKEDEPIGEAEPAGNIEPGTVFRDRLSDGAEGPEMIALPAGWFLMGSPDSDAEAEDSEKPRHYVAIGYSFAIGRYPVTNDEYEPFVEAFGRRKRHGHGWPSYRRQPATWVSWGDAKTYVAWLSEQTGKQYRLLSEAEWEYACRAGTETRYAVGDEITEEDANFGRSDHGSETTEVGSYPPNPWKLHDMHGNVWEWVEDHWHDGYTGAPGDGGAWTWTSGGNTDMRVQRGGSMHEWTEGLRSANRFRFVTGSRGPDIGFRVARTLDR